MLSPSTVYPRQAPPMRPSRSLEGLEKVIPPPRPPRPELQLNKPLPAKPLPEAPHRISTAWSDDTSTIESFGTPTPRESRDSTESYPIFVSSGSDDLVDIADQPSGGPISTLDHTSHRYFPTTPVTPQADSESESPDFRTFLSEERYGRQPNWSQHQPGSNHYFREKKWDFFPELATPSAMGPPFTGPTGAQKRRKDSRLGFDLQRNLARWNSSSDRGLAFAHEVRDSIRSYVNRTISKKSSFERDRRQSQSMTAPSDYLDEYNSLPKTPALTFSDRSDSGSSAMKNSYVNITERMRTLSMSSESIISERCATPRSIPMHRRRQLAVPLSPYQEYGATIWDKSGGSKRIGYRKSHRVRFPRYQSHRRISSSVQNCPKHGHVYYNQTPSLPPSPRFRAQLHQNTKECVRALQHGTNQMLDAIDGAKKKMSKNKLDRKRAQLKSKIRLVGPVNPYTTYGRVDPWI